MAGQTLASPVLKLKADNTGLDRGLDKAQARLTGFAALSKRVARVVIHRSPRYHAQDPFPWREVVERYGKDAVMVGSPAEHAAFCESFGKIPYHPTATLLDLARTIAGSDLFVGNQSTPLALAHGLGHRVWVEECEQCPNCNFPRANAWYGRDGLPRIEAIKGLRPFREFTEKDAAEQLRHLDEDRWLYKPGRRRFVCSLLGTLHQELRHDRPDLLPLILECVYIARRMNDYGIMQSELDWTS